jgi:hypothetical protein
MIVTYRKIDTMNCGILLVAIMPVQAAELRRQNKIYLPFLVRKSFRTAQGRLSRTVCNISAAAKDTRVDRSTLSGKT